MNESTFTSVHGVLLFNSFVEWVSQSGWLIAGVMLMLLALTFHRYRKRANKFRNETRLLQQQHEECKELLAYAKESEQKALEEVESSGRAKNLLLSKLSHEIRTPMNDIIGMASLLGETSLSDEQKEYVETIGSSGENLMLVINNMLISDVIDYSNAGQERIEIEHKDFHLPTIIEEALEVFADKSDQQKPELMYYIDQNVPAQIVGDPMRLKQVLMNVLENSLRFTVRGEVIVGVHLLKTIDKTQIELGFEVKDTGTGFPHEEIEILDKDIANADAKHDGNGLGLMICKKLLNLMGGYLKIDTKEGTGTVFKFTVRTRLSLQPQRVAVNPALQGKRVLITDDNFAHQAILKKLLAQWKLNVTLADSGKHAIDILAKNTQFDLMLVDLDMPGMNGIELMQTIVHKEIQIPAMLMNTKNDKRYLNNQWLFKAVLTKPLRHQLLYETLSTQMLQKVKAETETVKSDKQKLSTDLAKKYPLRILVAEDNPTNQQIAGMFLKKMGYEPEFVNNGQEALETVSEGNYDLIFMDVQMPVMDGLEATRMIRLCLNEQPVIIAMTANAMQGDRQICLQAGMDDYISKPIKIEGLLTMLERWGMKINDKHE